MNTQEGTDEEDTKPIYPRCTECGNYPLIVYATGETICTCGETWSMELFERMRVRIANGELHEFDGSGWNRVAS